MTRIMLFASVLALTVGLPASADTAHSVSHSANAAQDQSLSWTLSAKVNSMSPRALAIFERLAAESD